jgi:hypothetical protein
MRFDRWALFLPFAVAAFALPAAAEDGPLSQDERYLSRSLWKYIGGDTTYGLSDVSPPPPPCMQTLRFLPSHDLTRTCDDGSVRTGKWRLEITAGQEVIVLTAGADPAAALAFKIYYDAARKSHFDLVDPNSDKMTAKHVLIYERR